METLGILGEWDIWAQNSLTGAYQVPSVQEADIICLNLPPALRYEYAAKALLAKKHICCPAPAALSAEAYWSLLKLCNKQNRVFFEFHPILWAGIYQTLTQKIKNLGPVLSFDIKVSVPSILSLADGGGALINAALPALSLIERLAGAVSFVSAKAEIEKGMDTTLCLSLKAGEAQGLINASVKSGSNYLSLLCEGGGFIAEGPLLGSCRLFSSAEGEEIPCLQTNPYTLAADEFLGHIKRRSPLILGERIGASRRVYGLINEIKQQICLSHPSEKPYRVDL